MLRRFRMARGWFLSLPAIRGARPACSCNHRTLIRAAAVFSITLDADKQIALNGLRFTFLQAREPCAHGVRPRTTLRRRHARSDREAMADNHDFTCTVSGSTLSSAEIIARPAFWMMTNDSAI